MISSIEITAPLTVAAFDQLRSDITKRDEEGEKASINSRQYSDVDKLKPKKENNFGKDELDKQPNFSELAAKLRTFLDQENLAIEFSRDKSTKKMIMKIIDSKTQEIIRQYPPDITLKIARIVAQTLEQGQVTNAKV